jgi:hypothetical protein
LQITLHVHQRAFSQVLPSDFCQALVEHHTMLFSGIASRAY